MFSGAVAAFTLKDVCPGNLIRNGGFEEPKTANGTNKERGDPKWGFWTTIPGWYNTCMKVAKQSPFYEIHNNNMETAPEGVQSAEMLPDGTGIYCQDINVQKGARYELSFYYGRLQTVGWNGDIKGKFTVFQTAAVAVYRDATLKPPANPKEYPGDAQGYTVLIRADTKTQKGLWQKYSATFVAPSNKVTIAFTTTRNAPECTTCGSLMDAVCLQKGRYQGHMYVSGHQGTCSQL
eukprot:jgi/Chrzof1/4693/Cz14g23030.t1